MRAGVLTRLAQLPIRLQLGLVALLLALPAALIILVTGLRSREEALQSARGEALEFADEIALTQQNLVAGAQQLLMALAQLPAVREHRADEVRGVLRDCLTLNDQYSNIFVADLAGGVWASAVATAPFNVRDRRYFRQTMASGRFSAGEYVMSRATGRPAFNLGFPVRDPSGAVAGVISVGFNLERYRQLLEIAKLTPGTNYILLDHAGTVLGRGVNAADAIGRPYPAEAFTRMVDGPERDHVVGRGFGGDTRLIAYRKLRLPGEEQPYMYVRVGIPMEAVLGKANRALLANLALFLPFLALALVLALAYGTRAIARRTTRLQHAAGQLAAGDLSVRVSDEVVGGELGALARSFDEMARQLAERERARRLSDELYRQVFEVESDAIFLLEQETGRILEANPAAARLTGFSHDELLTLRNDELTTEPEVTRERTRGGTGALLAERTIRRKDGTLVECEVAAGFFVRDGQPAVLAAIRDVSARRRSERERRELAEQLAQSQKMEAIGRLAGGVAHDFNNLLTVIGGTTDLLLARMEGRKELVEDLGLIRDASRSAAGLTRQLLAFSRKQVLRPRIIDLNEVVRTSERMLQRVIGEDIRLETRLSLEPWSVRADPIQMEQVIMNLAVNARDAMPAGGSLRIETSNVTVESERAGAPRGVAPGRYALLTVTDTGLGMDPPTIARVFEPFFTTKGEGQGTGLGLATVYGIVQQSGGQIAVESTPGRQTTFRVFLPQATEHEPATREVQAPRPTASGGETVLVAEDAESVRRLVTHVLRRAGYDVLAAASGEEALELAARHVGPLHLFIADVVMPGITGRETADRLLVDRGDLRVLLMSGYGGSAAVTAGALRAGEDFLQKPFTPAQLEQKVRELLGRARARA
jgi:PAS domain S-box-containing protein